MIQNYGNIDLNCLIDSAYGMVLTNLFHTPTQKGEKRMLKAFSSAGKFM